MEITQLLKQCRQGSITAQKYLYDTFAASMFALCRRYVKNNAVAEEVLMTGFLKLFENLASARFNNEPSFIAWMKRIMINECLQELRKKTPFLIAVDDAPFDTMVQAENAIDQLSAAEIYELITRLPAGYRTVFNLYVIEALPHKEIALLLNISEGASKSQLSKARHLLQQLYYQQHNHYANRQTR